MSEHVIYTEEAGDDVAESYVFYEPTADAVVIYSAFHCSQDPEKWRTRLG